MTTYVDSQGHRRRLTRVQQLYLQETQTRRLRRGWGGMGSTLTVRLLEERGLVTVNWLGRDWELTGLTTLGRSVLGTCASS